MRVFKKILPGFLIVFLLLQLIRPAKNKSNQFSATDIVKQFQVPENIQLLLKGACYDCHSNNTNYPWYAIIQPFALILDRHIRRGKKELNFSEFGSYTFKRQINKLRVIGKQIKDDEMPLKSYAFMHSEARLTNTEKEVVINWAENLYSSMKAKNK
jgi:hypothetical protein